MVGLTRLGHNQQAGRSHVQPMGQHGRRTAAQHEREHRRLAALARHTEHARRFTDNGHGTVLVADVKCRGSRCRQRRVRSNVQSPQHMGENGLALALASRVVVQVVAYLLLGRASPPELRHAERPQPLAVGILQQLRRTAVAGTARRQREALAHTLRMVVLPYLHEILPHPTGVKQLVLVEKPPLEVLRLLLTLHTQPHCQRVTGRQRGNLSVHTRNTTLRLLEVTVGLLGIIDGRHKPRPVVTPCQQTAVGSQESQAPVGSLHHQHTEHLAAVGVFLHLGSAGNIALHLSSSLNAQRMRLVAKGERELPGTLLVC